MGTCKPTGATRGEGILDFVGSEQLYHLIDRTLAVVARYDAVIMEHTPWPNQWAHGCAHAEIRNQGTS